MPEGRHRWFKLRKFHSWSTEGEVSLCLHVMLHRWVMGFISRPHSGLIFMGWHVAQYCWAFQPLNLSTLHCLKVSCTNYSAVWRHVSGEWRPWLHPSESLRTGIVKVTSPFVIQHRRVALSHFCALGTLSSHGVNIYFIEKLMDHIWNMDTFIDWGNHHTILSLKPHAWKSKISTVNKHRIVVIGDTHIKGCSEILSDRLDNTYNVTGFSKYNTDFKAIIPTISTEIKHLNKNVVVTVCGGTQKIGKNGSNLGLRYPTHFAFVVVILTWFLYVLRSDSIITLLVSTTVIAFNRKL